MSNFRRRAAPKGSVPFLRSRTRMLLILVALASAAAWGFVMKRRSQLYFKEASDYEAIIKFDEARISNLASDRFDDSMSKELIRRLLLQYKKEAQYHKEMFDKYRYASNHPWLTVEPDPPPPEDSPPLDETEQPSPLDGETGT